MIPPPTGDRIQLLDVLRGLAIFGMFFVNMTWDFLEHTYLPKPFGFADQAVMDLVDVLASGKFVTIFSSEIAAIDSVYSIR